MRAMSGKWYKMETDGARWGIVYRAEAGQSKFETIVCGPSTLIIEAFSVEKRNDKGSLLD